MSKSKVYVAPEKVDWSRHAHVVFIAGSIEQGTAEDWQVKLTNKLRQFDDLAILNPRRANWDATLRQSKDEPVFNEQVTWELNGIENSETVIFYFDPNTKSPITLLELGLVAGISYIENVFVCCPEGFYRKGNVDIIVERMKIKKQNVYECKTLSELITVTNNFFSDEDNIQTWSSKNDY
jgi:hypothetical protein